MNVKRLMTTSLILLGITIGTIACSSPVKPEDEPKNKLHDDPYRAVFTLTEGKLDGTAFTATGTTQIMTFDGRGGWAVTSDSATKEFRVKADGKTAYFLNINYLNKEGSDITSDFVTNGQEKIHQHFFIATDFQPATKPDGVAFKDGDSSLYDYLYLDTDPWNVSVEQGGKLLGSKNPIGFKGAFHFFIPRISFQIKIKLMHGRGTKMNQKNQFSPYNKPTNSQLANMPWDIETKVPFVTIK